MSVIDAVLTQMENDARQLAADMEALDASIRRYNQETRAHTTGQAVATMPDVTVERTSERTMPPRTIRRAAPVTSLRKRPGGYGGATLKKNR